MDLFASLSPTSRNTSAIPAVFRPYNFLFEFTMNCVSVRLDSR